MNKETESAVQWFPGHMAKTRRIIKECLPLVDCLTVVLDARVPLSSRNPEIDVLSGGKPKIYVLSKRDLADADVTARWLSYYGKDGFAAAVDCKTGAGLSAYVAELRRACSAVAEGYEKKGMAGRSLRTMVVGVPNSGKSSLINRMAGGRKAQTEDRAGVTKKVRWFRTEHGVDLLDTPGVLWPKFDDPAVGARLAFTGGVRDEILDFETLACDFLAVMTAFYPEKIADRYGVAPAEYPDAYSLLEAIARKRGMMVRGGEADTGRAAVTLFDEYRAGKLGRISLETP